MDKEKYDHLKTLKVLKEKIMPKVEECKHFWQLGIVPSGEPDLKKLIWYCQRCRKIEDYE